MQDEWFVRVHGKEYGPVDLDELREWQAEGRLIPENELRRGSGGEWVLAASVPELFPVPSETAAHEELFRRRTMVQIIGDSFGIYFRGFLPLFGLALLVAVPSLLMQLSLAFVHAPQNGVTNRASTIASFIALAMFLAVLIAWPVFVAGLQFATADLAAGRRVRFRDLLGRAANVWQRMARLSIAVYGSYVFWTALPLLVVIGISSREPSIASLLIGLLAGAVQVYMAGRLFINFLFWQQSATIGGLGGIDALRDSKELARSRPEGPLFDRPLYRGAILAAIWLVIWLALAIAVQLPFLMIRLQGITTVEEVSAMVQDLFNAPAPDGLTIATYVASGLAHALLRPLLGITFVLLYFDAKARR